MIITRKQLEEIENTVGYSCEAGVLAGREQGDIAIRVWVDQLGGQSRIVCEEIFCSDKLIDDCERKLERFKHWAKSEFDSAFCHNGKRLISRASHTL